ncbi:MAG: hypothetical protein KGI50_04145 [Patescibacteria group bacterium]|nr:hypothetical protein [Patescibacteria group bacterium]
MNSELINRLKNEEEELVKELGEVSVKTEAGFEPKPTDFGSDTESYDGEEADEAEELGNSLSVKTVLESRLRHVRSALRKIESNTYGTCEHCGTPIEERDLEIDPARPHCKKCSE